MIALDHLFAARHHFGTLAAPGIRRAQPGFGQPEPQAAVGGLLDAHRLTVPQEFDAFFAGIGDFAP